MPVTEAGEWTLRTIKSSNNLGMWKAQSSSHTAGVNAVCYSSMKTSKHNSSPKRVKRLKTRKERNKIRGQESNRSQHNRKVGSEKAQLHGCRHSHAVVSSRKVQTFAKPFLPHKPSIITEGRLTSIRGLFSHKVKSADIERVVSEQLKKKSVMHVTSPLPPHPPSMPDSDQDCILNTVQKPLQEPENTMKVSRKEITRKYPNALQTNKEATVCKESSSQDERQYRSAKTGKEYTNNKSRPDCSSSLNGTYEHLSSESESIWYSTTLQKTHSFHLQHNLFKQHSYFDGKQTDGFGSGQTHEDCSQICFSHAWGNEESKHNRNIDIWPENTIQQEYPAEKAKQDPDRGASMKKHSVQAEGRFSPSASLIPPLQAHADMSLQFDQSRTARLSQDCFRAQHYPRTMFFQQDQSFSQLATPIPSTPTWVNHYEPCSQQLLGDLQGRGKSMKNVGLDLISHQWEEKTDPVFKSSIWSNQLQVQDIREQWAHQKISSSATFPLEGFRYKPFFRFPHPSNSQDRSDWPGQGQTLCARSNTDKVFYHH